MAQEQHIVQTIRTYGERLFGFIRRRVDSDADAEDILQDVWFQFARLVDSTQIENVSAWLYRVARNKLTDRYRRRQPLSLEELTFEDEDGGVRLLDILADDADSPEADLFRQAFWEELFAALDELPDKQREVFIRNELEGHTFREISEQTGENIKTLISRKRYAVMHLRDRLDVLYGELMKE